MGGWSGSLPRGQQRHQWTTCLGSAVMFSTLSILAPTVTAPSYHWDSQYQWYVAVLVGLGASERQVVICFLMKTILRWYAPFRAVVQCSALASLVWPSVLLRAYQIDLARKRANTDNVVLALCNVWFSIITAPSFHQPVVVARSKNRWFGSIGEISSVSW